MSSKKTAPEPLPCDWPFPNHSGRQRKQTKNTQEQRERILAVAARLFDEKGYAGTSIEDIAQALEVTKPFVYYYFKNKQEIFETLTWIPTVACFTSLDFPDDDNRSASEKIIAGLSQLIRVTIEHQPAAFFIYREPTVYRPEFIAAERTLARHFHEKLKTLLEQGRADGDLDFNDTRITAMAACSLPGFLYIWYRPNGRLTVDQIIDELSNLIGKIIGLKTGDKIECNLEMNFSNP